MRKLLQLESSRLSAGLFVTLTYHNRWPSDQAGIQRHLARFLAAFRRKYPHGHYCWRIEFQRRGAPHFHLITWRDAGAGDYDRAKFSRWAVETWQRAAGEKSDAHRRHGVDVRAVESHRAAVSYVSKYVAKCSDEKPTLSPREWG